MNIIPRIATSAVVRGPAVSKGQVALRRLTASESDSVHGSGGKLGLSGGGSDPQSLSAREQFLR